MSPPPTESLVPQRKVMLQRTLAFIALLSFPLSQLVLAAQPPIEILTLQWGDSKRPDGTVRHWDPKPLIDLGATLVCVAYRPYTSEGTRWFGVGMTPPKLLAKTLENTRPELDECHRHGIKVIGYADTIMFHPEMFELDGIPTDDFYARNPDGTPIINKSWDRTGAPLSCVTNPRWLQLQKQVTRVTAQAGFDGLQFDVYPYAINPGYNCCCRYCQEAWRKHSRKIFGSPKPMPVQESGKLDFRNSIDRVFKTWRLQEYVDFVKALESDVHKSHPAFQVIMNHGGGTPDYTYETSHGGLDIPSTELWHLRLGDDSSLYIYSSTEAANGKPAIGLINSAEQRKPYYRYRVALAEAFGGGGTFYFSGFGKADSEPAKINQEWCNFLRKHAAWFADTKSGADVAVLYSWRDQAFLQGDPIANARVEFDPKRSHYQRAAAVLARLGIPFDTIIVERGMSRSTLTRYRIIIAPELSLVSENDAKALQRYTLNGGKLFSLGQLGTLKDLGPEYLPRREPLLQTWIGRPPKSGETVAFGKGWIGFANQATTEELVPPPAADPSIAGAEAKPVKLGVPLKKLSPDFESVSDRLGLSAQLRIEAASQLESTIRAKDNRLAIHLIRFGPPERVQDRSVKIRYQLPERRIPSEVSVWSPELPGTAVPSKWKVHDHHLVVAISKVDTSAMVAVTLQPTR